MATAAKNRPTVRMPAYMQEFRCIAGDCEDSCCSARWDIFIDRAAYDGLRQCRGPGELAARVERHMVLNRSNPTAARYALFESDRDRCPFESADGLCVIHRDAGAHRLPRICYQYPRQTLAIEGCRIETAAAVSCPEAARKALANPRGIEFVDIQMSAHEFEAMSVTLRLAAGSQTHAVWAVRDFSIQILQNRVFGLWERLVLLGMFFSRAAPLYQAGKTGEILKLADTFRALMGEVFIRENLAAIPTRNTVQLNLLKKLTDENLAFKIASPVFVKCFRQFLAGIDYDQKRYTKQQIGVSYDRAYRNSYLPFIRRHEYLLENYLVNHTFMNMFPGRHGDLKRYYVQMVLCFAMIKMYLIGMAAHHGGRFSEAMAMELIYSFVRNVEHNPGYLQQLHTLLEKEGLTGTAHMAILLKN